MNKIPIAIVSMLLQTALVWFIPALHHTWYIIVFFCLLLFAGVIVQESREDMPPKHKALIGGFVWGTYGAAAIMSVAVYEGWLVLRLM